MSTNGTEPQWRILDDAEPGALSSHLSRDECMSLLRTASVGRLVTNVREVIDVLPLNYSILDDEILLLTTPGSKLVELTIHPTTLFEVDEITASNAWSVVVRGTARILEHADEILRAEAVGVPTILPDRTVYVAIHPDSVTGRWIRRDHTGG